MKASTALAFVASGVSLWLYTMESPQLHRIAPLCGAAVVVIALLGAAGLDLPLDRFLSKDSSANADLFGRMDIITAIMFMALGVTLVLLRDAAHAAKATALALATAVASLLAVAEYFFQVPALSSFEAVAPHSAIGLLTLAVGVVCARPGSARITKPASRQAGGFLSRLMPTAAAQSGARGMKSAPNGRRELDLFRIFRESAIAIAEAVDPSTARDVLLEKTEVLFPFASAVTLRWVNPSSGELEPVAMRTAAGTEWTIDENQALGGRAAKPLTANTPMIVRNLQTDGQVSNQLYRKHGWVSYLGVPLLARGEALGIIGVYTKEQYEFSPEEADVLMGAAAAAAVVLSSMPAAAIVGEPAVTAAVETPSEQTFKALQLLPGVYAALAPLNQTESLNETVNGVVEKVVEATGADAAILRMWKKETGASLISGHRGMAEDFAKQMEIGLLKGALESVVQTGEGIVAPDVDAEPRFATKVQQQLGFRSSAVLPLKMHNEVRGVLYVASRNAGFFDLKAKDLLMAIAQQIGISMENRELFDHLKNSRDELEKASKIKGEFLSVMSHELRTPLSVVMGYAGMIKEKMLGEINPQQDDALQKLLTRANDQLNMINAIMQITQLESRSLVLERHLVNLTEMLSHLKSDYALTHTKQQVALNWEFPAAPVVIVTDGGKLKEILVNLVNNAIKFTPQGTVTIAMSIEEDHRKKWVQLSVKDTGVGIPKEQFTAIFEKFYQVDSSETRLYGGVGLGLYIVKHFAAFLGGKVEVKSEPGRGSTFIVTIPYAT